MAALLPAEKPRLSLSGRTVAQGDRATAASSRSTDSSPEALSTTTARRPGSRGRLVGERIAGNRASDPPCGS